MTPADGDRLDLGGKVPQFRAFTYFVYRHLTAGDLAWVRIADVQADKLDDIQFATDTEIHAYQMKWSNQEQPPPFSFRNFSELLFDMVKGWQELKMLHSSEYKQLYVHVITNRNASVNDEILSRTGSKLGTFSDFLEKVYQPIKNARPVGRPWLEILARLRQGTGLGKIEFLDFFSALTVNIAFVMPEISGSRPEDRKQQQDYLELNQFIINEIADKKKKIHYTREELIRSLGWEHRFKTTFQHEFFVDKHRYQPITSTIAALDKLVGSSTSGYVFLKGSPGAGKSTLLTQWSRASAAHIVRYYAFSNISISQNFSERGESEKFYFDLVVQLNELMPVSRQTVLPHHDEAYLRRVFFDQLKELSESYQTSGKKTVIIVDGLDHIPREYQTTKSLIGGLPAPSALPEGILIVLGSQSFELEVLQPDVRGSYRNGDRNITIDLLDRKAVLNYIGQYQPKVHLTPEQKEKVFELSKGHPLQLTYLLEQLSAVSENILAVLGSDFNYASIDDYYQKIWDSINDDADLQSMLSVMARVRGEIDPDFVNEWGFPDKVKAEFRKKAFHLFSKSRHAWVFFHNSFRQFIIRQTATDALTGKASPKKDQELHTKLADLYAASKVAPVWDRLFHLYHSRQYHLFIKEATGQAFLEQILAYRPIEKVRQDMKLGLRIAGEQRDHVLLMRYLFMLSELNTRTENFNPINFVEQHLMLGNTEVAVRYMRDDHVLNSSKRFALAISQDLFFGKQAEEAIKLYTLAEPDEIQDNGIVAETDHHYDDTNATLEEWASAAPLFEDTEGLIELIRHTQQDGDRNRMAGNDSAAHLRGRLFFYAAQTAIAEGHWDKVDRLLAELERSDTYDRHLVILLLIAAVKESPHAVVADLQQQYFGQLTAFDPADCSERERVMIGLTIFKQTGDLKAAEKWADGVAQPKVTSLDLSEREDLRAYYQRFELNVLLNILGKGVTPSVAVPSTGSNYDDSLVEFERMLVLMAGIRADALLNKNAHSLLPRIKPLYGFYYVKRGIRDTNKYRLSKLRCPYFKLLIETCGLFGVDALRTILVYTIDEFAAHEDHWDPEQKIQVLFEFIEQGLPKVELIPQLLTAEVSLLDGTDMAGRVSRAKAQAISWLSLGERDHSERWIHKTITESLSIGYSKDYQLNTWLEWLRRVNNIEPQHGQKRLQHYLERMRYVKDVTELRPFFLAAKKLLSVIYEWDTGAGVSAQKYMLNNGLVHYEDSLSELVTGLLTACSLEDLPVANDLFGELLLDLAEEAHDTVLRQLLDRLWEAREVLELDEELRRCVAMINVNALDITRNHYFAELVRFSVQKDVDISALDIPTGIKAAKEGFEYDNHFTQEDRSHLTEDEVLEKVHDFDSLKVLYLKEDPANSGFRWDKAFDKVSQELTAANIRDLTRHTHGRRQNAAIYCQFSKAALRAGDQALAAEMANLAIEWSSSAGWNEHYDGGTRINGFKALQMVEGVAAVDKAYQTFLADLLATDYPTSYTESMDDILPVLVTDIKLSEVYLEVEQHADNLLSNAVPDTEAANVLSPRPGAVEEHLFDILHYLSRYPASPVKERACCFMARHLGYFRADDLARLAEGDDGDQELFVDLLNFNQHEWELIAALAEPILKLRTAKSFVVRRGAIALTGLLDPDSVNGTGQPILMPLNPTYTIEIQKLPTFRPETTVDEEGNIIDTEDVTTITSYARIQSKAIAKTFGFVELNVHHRLVAIMGEIATPYNWSSANEKKLRAGLEAAGNKMSMVRPRVALVLKAVARMVTELDDSGYKLPPYYLPHFFYKDLDTWTLEPSTRPDFIAALKNGRSSVGKDWVHDVKKHQRLNDGPAQLLDGWMVIGEYHYHRQMEWGFPLERYQSHLRSKHATDGFHGQFIFGSAEERRMRDYLDLDAYPDSGYLVVTNELFSPIAGMPFRWIAFNPKIAAELGWEPAEDEPFAWGDEDGEPVARSVYWKDGNINLAQRASESETAEGWYLAVSPSAMKAIAELYEDLVFEKRIDRDHEDDRKKVSDKLIAVQAFKV